MTVKAVSAVVALATTLAAAPDAAAHIRRLFPGQTVLVTRADVLSGGSYYPDIRPRPSVVPLGVNNPPIIEVHWTGWGTGRAVGRGFDHSSVAYFVASRPRLITNAPECATDSARASIRMYTELSFSEDGYHSKENVAWTSFPFDC
jgi:hypothetical protein